MSIKLVDVSNTETGVVFEESFSCRECQKEITRTEWKDLAKMCQHCYDTDGS